MKRRRAREYALQILFQLELTGKEPDDQVFKDFWEENDAEREVREFTADVVKNTWTHIPELDKTIKEAAQHWSIERMAVIDRNILRAAAYELVFRKDIPATVAINEAIEIAKKYSTEESASFINGILDKIAHSLSPAAGHKEK